MFKKKKNRYSKESLLRLLVEQQTTIEQQEEKIRQLEKHVQIMDRLARQIQAGDKQ